MRLRGWPRKKKEGRLTKFFFIKYNKKLLFFCLFNNKTELNFNRSVS